MMKARMGIFNKLVLAYARALSDVKFQNFLYTLMNCDERVS